MKIVLSLLQEFIALAKGTTPQTIEAALIQLGHEVEGIHTAGGAFPNVVIGKILERKQHPNADRLGVCTVDVGEKTSRQIVCGAPNARAGLTVAVALPGAVLPGDFHIKVSKIRDVESCGMICSLDELGMSKIDEPGIWEMDTKAKVGTPLSEALGPGETVMEIAITPNRGDCLSHLGMARDLAALGIGKLKQTKIAAAGKAKPSVKAETTTNDCPEINLIEITGIKNGPSPAHVQRQLEALGLRPKNALVDATNYAMVALGQPLHAYDAAKVKSPITAAAAKGGESYQGLGDVKLTLAKEDVIISDANGIVGLGGILGGEGSAVSESTTHVILEAAHFNAVRIALTGQAHQLHTDARQRFERGVDPELAKLALLYCAQLISEWTGGKTSAMVSAGKGVAAPKPITYAPAFFDKFIGLKIAPAKQKTILQSLGFKVAGGATSWKITPPSYRTYMATPEDLTEEILRVIGYDKVPSVLPPSNGGQFQIDGSPVTLDRTARKALAAGGFLEVITYSFIGQNAAESFANGNALITLANPLAQTDMTTLRPSLLPGLLAALKGNIARSEPTARLAEVGKTFTAKAESLMAAGILVATGQRHWSAKEKQPDVFAAKAAALQALATLDAPVESGTIGTQVPAHYHPGRSGTLAVGPFTLATFGELHPALAKALDVPAVAMFELHLDSLLKLNSKARPWQPLPYPPVHRDLAFLLPKNVTAQQVLATIRASNRDLLRKVEVFDHYVGERIPADKQSLALSLTLQSPDKTLTDGDIAPVMKAAVDAVTSKHQGQLRA